MSLTEQYAQALFPDPVRVLGRALQPYCIGHALLLHRVGNAFVVPPSGGPADAGPGIGDLLQGVWTCSRTWQAAAAGLATPRVRRMLRFWGWQTRTFCPPIVRVMAEDTFAGYLARGLSGPSLWERDTPADQRPRKPGAPFLLALAVRLKGYFRCTTDQALSWPVSVALFDCAAWAEALGEAELVSDQDLAAMDKALEDPHG